MAVAYNKAFHIGKVMKIDFVKRKVTVNFMAGSKNGYYSWPRRQDLDEVNINFIFRRNILFVGTGQDGGGFIDSEEEIIDMFEQYKFDYMM